MLGGSATGGTGTGSGNRAPGAPGEPHVGNGKPVAADDPAATTVPDESSTTVPSSDGTVPAPTPGSTPAGKVPVVGPTTPVGHPPIANDDTLTGLVSTTYTVDVLANDSDPDGNLDPSTLSIMGTSTSSLKATVVQGKIQVDLAALLPTGFWVVYQVCDTTGLCAKATLSGTMALTIVNPK
jgi:hypothetical protein